MATYEEAGVDLAAAEALVRRIADDVTSTWSPSVVGDFGGFAAGITLPTGYRSPILMMTTDGVGTKAEVAQRAGRVDGLGFDLVAMCVDDLAAVGATPLAMTDYIALEHLDLTMVAALVASMARACRTAGVALLGGETAEHPGVMPTGSFDISGAALGVIEAGEEITGAAISAGDLIVGLESPNLRANGFSFIRAHLLKDLALDDRYPGTELTVADVILEPSIIYAPAIGALIADVPVTGLAHITGGGLPGNIERILPNHLEARIDTSAWARPPVFEALPELTGTEPSELYAVFNMGIGFVAVMAPPQVSAALRVLERHGIAGGVIGEIATGPNRVRLG